MDISNFNSLCQNLTWISCTHFQLSLNVFSPRDDLACQSCDCHVIGSASDQCSPVMGQCRCRRHVTGRRCDRCEVGYAGMDEEGCKGEN